MPQLSYLQNINTREFWVADTNLRKALLEGSYLLLMEVRQSEMSILFHRKLYFGEDKL